MQPKEPAAERDGDEMDAQVNGGGAKGDGAAAAPSRFFPLTEPAFGAFMSRSGGDARLPARRLCARVCDGTLAVDAIDEEAMEAEVTVNDGFPEPVRRAEGIDARRSPAARPPARPESARVRSQMQLWS